MGYAHVQGRAVLTIDPLETLIVLTFNIPGTAWVQC